MTLLVFGFCESESASWRSGRPGSDERDLQDRVIQRGNDALRFLQHGGEVTQNLNGLPDSPSPRTNLILAETDSASETPFGAWDPTDDNQTTSAANQLDPMKFNNPFGARVPWGVQHYFQDPVQRELQYNRAIVRAIPMAAVQQPNAASGNSSAGNGLFAAPGAVNTTGQHVATGYQNTVNAVPSPTGGGQTHSDAGTLNATTNAANAMATAGHGRARFKVGSHSVRSYLPQTAYSCEVPRPEIQSWCKQGSKQIPLRVLRNRCPNGRFRLL